jgi:hypothetical protein
VLRIEEEEMSKKQNVYGEGNYAASRRYYADTKKFVDSGRVDAAARETAPETPAEAADMRRAEEAALLRAKGKRRAPPVKEPDAPAPQIDEPETGPDAPQEGTAPRPGRGPYRR